MILKQKIYRDQYIIDRVFFFFFLRFSLGDDFKISHYYLGITRLSIFLAKISWYLWHWLLYHHDVFPLEFTPCRNQLSSLLLSSKEWKASHTAIRCIVFDPPGHPVTKVQNSAYDMFGSATVSCYASCTSKLKCSFPTCGDQYMHGAQAIHKMQK